MSSESLHPQNDRVGSSGITLPGLNYHRFPPVYVTEDGGQKHETPLCPNVRGKPHRMICREDAVYVYGENWCDTCRWHRVSRDESGWTDPRYRTDGEA